MTRKQKSFFDAAKAVSESSEFPKVHIGCVVTYGNHRIISSGCNSTRTHPLQKKLNKILSKNTKKSIKKIENDIKKDFYMSAVEACEYGLIDKVL